MGGKLSPDLMQNSEVGAAGAASVGFTSALSSEKGGSWRAWEILLLLLGLLLALASAGMSLKRATLLSYFFPAASGVSLDEMGVLKAAIGEVRRQKAGESSFEDLKIKQTLFNEDTLVTDSNSNAVLDLGAGGEISLGPGSMVKLSFERKFSLGGITQTQNVEVVSGEVRAKPTSSGLETNNVASGAQRPAVQVVIKKKELSKAQLVTPPATPLAPALQSVKTLATKLSQVELPKLTFPNLVNPAPVVVPEIAKSPISALPTEAVQTSPLPAPTESPLPLASVSVEPSPVLVSSTPLPEPIQNKIKVSILNPREGDVFGMSSPFVEPKVNVQMNWSTQPFQQKLNLRVTQMEGGKLREVFSQEVQDTRGKGSFPLQLKRPGLYQWELLSLDGQALGLKPVSFHVKAEADHGIQTLEPLVDGESLTSNRLKVGKVDDKLKESFEVQLRWKPISWSKSVWDGNYRVRLGEDPRLIQVLLDQKTANTELKWSRGRTFKGKIYYEVLAESKAGFTLRSAKQSWSFAFEGPVLVSPKNKSTLQAKDLLSEVKPVLLTWEKTQFTQAYILQISIEPTFGSKEVETRTKDNFYILPELKPGRYFWRVLSVGEAFASEPSEVFRFEIVE